MGRQLLFVVLLALAGLTLLLARHDGWDSVPLAIRTDPVAIARESESPGRALMHPGPLEDGPVEALVAPRERLASQGVPVEPAESGNTGLHALLARLIEIEERQPERFHEEAARELEAFVADRRGPAGASPVEGLLELLERPALPARVRGALLALFGACGEQQAVLSRTDLRGEVFRSALVGLAWEPEGASLDALPLDPREFLEKAGRGGRTVLDLPLGRTPDGVLRATLASLVLEPASDLDGLLTRDLLVLVAGLALDQDPEILALFRRLLLDPSPEQRQIRSSLVYVLTRARSEAARRLLLEFLEDGRLGSEGKVLARWWMGGRVVVPGELGALMAPLFDPTASNQDRMAATGALLKRLDVAPPEELPQIEEVLAARALEEDNEAARLAAVSTLALAPGGLTKLSTLEQVLRKDGLAACRLWAAHGLARVDPALGEEARALLRGALSREGDPGVRHAISEILGVAQEPP